MIIYTYALLSTLLSHLAIGRVVVSIIWYGKKYAYVVPNRIAAFCNFGLLSKLTTIYVIYDYVRLFKQKKKKRARRLPDEEENRLSVHCTELAFFWPLDIFIEIDKISRDGEFSRAGGILKRMGKVH